MLFNEFIVCSLKYTGNDTPLRTVFIVNFLIN